MNKMLLWNHQAKMLRELGGDINTTRYWRLREVWERDHKAFFEAMEKVCAGTWVYLQGSKTIEYRAKDNWQDEIDAMVSAVL